MKIILKWTMRIIAAIAIFILLSFLGLMIYFRSIKVDQPGFASSLHPRHLRYTSPNDSVRLIGNNYLLRIDTGMYEMYVEGSPFERGEVMGALTADLHAFQEEAFIRQIQKMVPSPVYLKFLKYFITFFNRHIQDFIPRENLEEIYGESLYMSSKYDDMIGSPYMRILNYHAAHDIGHALQDKNFVAGCTSFAAWGDHTEGSDMLVGRNFDFYVGDEFAKNKLVVFMKPDKGLPFAMVSWPGMTGVVSGMNTAGLTVTINAAKSNYPTEAKTPVSIVARNILQYAGSIDEAIQTARRFDMFVSESILVSSGKENKAVIIEKSPLKMDVFYPDSSLLFCSNHFQSGGLKDDPNNLSFMENSSTMYRFRRLQQLTRGIQLNSSKVAAILRDPYGLDNRHIGWGNEDALNQLIAHHGVIFRPEKGEMWVSTHPFQVGKMVYFNLNDVFRHKNFGLNHSKDIPADEDLMNKAVGPYLQFKSLVDTIKHSKGRVDDRLIRKMTALNPNYYYGYEVAGDYFMQHGESSKAEAYYDKSLKQVIPNLPDKEAIQRKKESCQLKQ
ncbi:MAG: hypothetical protein J5I59_13575 [Saprospiraceae bacterium]|nr:hypothetical protein [Saprospiraceae bacterium]